MARPLNTPRHRRLPADDWDRTIIAVPSAYHLKELAIDQGRIGSEPDKTTLQNFKIRLATNDDRQQSANLLIEKMYSLKGYGKHEIRHDPYRITLAAYQNDKVVGTLTLGFDSPEGLAADRMYKLEVDALRAEGRRICEITKFAVDHQVKSKRVLATLFHLTQIYGHHLHQATDFLIEVTPRHAAFYRRMVGFVPYGEERLNTRVNVVGVLLRIEASYCDEQVRRYGGKLDKASGVNSIYPYVFSKEEEAGIIQRLLRETHE